MEIGTKVRLKPEVESEKPAHTGKHFIVTGYAGKFLKIKWQNMEFFFLPSELIIVTN